MMNLTIVDVKLLFNQPTFLRLSAPVEDTMVSSSISIPGKGVTSDPRSRIYKTTLKD